MKLYLYSGEFQVFDEAIESSSTFEMLNHIQNLLSEFLQGTD